MYRPIAYMPSKIIKIGRILTELLKTLKVGVFEAHYLPTSRFEMPLEVLYLLLLILSCIS